MTRREEVLYAVFLTTGLATYGDPLFFAEYAALVALVLALAWRLESRRKRLVADLFTQAQEETARSS